MRSPRRIRKEATPLDAKQQALAAQQQELREKMERLERLIEEAPILAEETEKRRREEMLARATQGARRIEAPSTLFDKRAYHVEAAPGKRKSLRAEKAEARLKFFFWCLVLVLLLGWLYTRIH